MKTIPNHTQDRQQLVNAMAKAAGVVKLICGVANNVAWLVTLDAYDHAKQCKRYRHEVKKAFKQAIAEWHAYENRLVHARVNRMFHVADLAEVSRKQYGDITDRQYYDFWASAGGPAYTKTKPLITSLVNKQRLSLEHHGVKDAEHIAWLLTASASMDIAHYLLEQTMKNVANDHHIPHNIVKEVFEQFSVAPQRKAWGRAVLLLEPMKYTLEPIERRNIQMGLDQLAKEWTSPTLLYNSVLDSVEDYEEVFRTPGYQAKAMRELTEIRDLTNDEL